MRQGAVQQWVCAEIARSIRGDACSSAVEKP